tara:strand:+ start:2587 stop:2952 length:366 start_codon:yes stop_codon:yes gene_type:complete
MINKIVEYFSESSQILNENKYFIGLSMILVNIGSRYIIDDLNNEHRNLIRNEYVRKIFIFCVFFMSTRDVLISLFLTILFVIFIKEIFNFEEKNTEKKEGSNNKDEINMVIDRLKEVTKNI